MKEGAARTSGPLFLYNVSELEKVPLTGPLGVDLPRGRGWGGDLPPPTFPFLCQFSRVSVVHCVVLFI